MAALSLIAADSSGSGAPLLISLLLMVAIFYFLLIRPQQRRARAQRELTESLDVGDEVITVGGIFGTITGLDDEGVTVEVAPGTRIRFLRSAIMRKRLPEDEESEEVEGAEEETSE